MLASIFRGFSAPHFLAARQREAELTEQHQALLQELHLSRLLQRLKRGICLHNSSDIGDDCEQEYSNRNPERRPCYFVPSVEPPFFYLFWPRFFEGDPDIV